jgi:hypothetical protein
MSKWWCWRESVTEESDSSEINISKRQLNFWGNVGQNLSSRSDENDESLAELIDFVPVDEMRLGGPRSLDAASKSDIAQNSSKHHGGQAN